ncbi:MAG: hypothetical protein Q9211_001946 [Gyalolechia sp. 1 TL-2023]
MIEGKPRPHVIPDSSSKWSTEIPNPTVQGPRIMIACVGIGTFTGFVFLMVLLLVAGPIEDVIESAAGPLLHIFFYATNSRTGSIMLLLLYPLDVLLFPLVCLLFATTGIMTTSSRMTWAFARDGGLPLSKVFAQVHPTLGLPLNSLYLTTAAVVIFGCIFLGSDSAFNAIISASVVALGLSYAMPIAINCLRGRKMLGLRPFMLPESFAWGANLLGIAYVIVTTVLFVFPPELPVTGSNMSKLTRAYTTVPSFVPILTGRTCANRPYADYCIVAFAIVIIISTVQWFVDGRKNFKGPRVDLEVVHLET